MVCLVADLGIFAYSVIYELQRMFYVAIIFGTLYLAAQIFMWDFAAALGLSRETSSKRVRFLVSMDLDHFLRWMNAVICGMLIFIGLSLVRLVNNIFKGFRIDYGDPVVIVLSYNGFLALFLTVAAIVVVYAIKWFYQLRINEVLGETEYKDFIGYLNSFVMFSVIIGFGGRLLVSSFIIIYITLIVLTTLFRLSRRAEFSIRETRETIYRIRMTFFGIFYQRHTSVLARIMTAEMFASSVILLLNVSFVNIYNINTITIIVPYVIIIISLLTLYFGRLYGAAATLTTSLFSFLLVLFFIDYTYQPILQFLVDDLASVGAIRLYPEAEEVIMDTFSRLLIGLYLMTIVSTAVTLMDHDRSIDEDVVRRYTLSTYQTIMILAYWMLIFGAMFIQIPPEYGIDISYEWGMYQLIVVLLLCIVAIMYLVNLTTFTHDVRTGTKQAGDSAVVNRLTSIVSVRSSMRWAYRRRTVVVVVAVSMFILAANVQNALVEPSDTYLDGEGSFKYDVGIRFEPIKVEQWLEVDISIRNGNGTLFVQLFRIEEDEDILVWYELEINEFNRRDELDEGVYALYLTNSELKDDPDDTYTLDMIIKRDADQLFPLQPGFWTLLTLYIFAVPPAALWLRYREFRGQGAG
ncbi:MAG: hypothetical protein JSW25_00205 [Thermoplasmata archaeon]|nr:MAG: hypothetical protein JSW25_00205 [Thermoplasmata archaeon]